MDKLTIVLNEIKNIGAEVLPIIGNATKVDDIKHILNETIQHFDGIDILINNVGNIGRISPFMEINDEWVDFFTLNVMSSIRFSKACLSFMKKSNWGRIIFIHQKKQLLQGSICRIMP